MKRIIGSLAGGLVVYVAVACSAADPATVASLDAGSVPASGGVSAGGTTGAAGTVETPSGGQSGGLLDAAVDAVTNPVSDAQAQEDSGTATVCDCPPPYVPPEPEVVTVPCDVEVTIGASTILHAVAEFPGRTVDELSAIRAVLNYAEEIQNPSPPGYLHRTASFVGLADGSATVQCGTRNYDAAESVTFTLP